MDSARSRRPLPDSPLTLVGVWAHPDDEAYLSAGLMGRVVDGGGRVVCVHATDGELGTTDPRAWPPPRLAALRRAELRASLAALGVTESVRLGLPDGALATLPARAPTETIAELLAETQPDLVVTFGPDGMTGHPDHRTVCRWTADAWHRTGRCGDLLYATTTEEFADRHGDLYERHDLVLAAGLPLRTPAEHVALDVALDRDELDRKLVALRAHASQTDPMIALLGAERYRHWFDHETFRRPLASELTGTAA